MKLRKCASIMAFAIELADMDGDGDLDLVHHNNDKGNILWDYLARQPYWYSLQQRQG